MDSYNGTPQGTCKYWNFCYFMWDIIWFYCGTLHHQNFNSPPPTLLPTKENDNRTTPTYTRFFLIRTSKFWTRHVVLKFWHNLSPNCSKLVLRIAHSWNSRRDWVCPPKTKNTYFQSDVSFVLQDFIQSWDYKTTANKLFNVVMSIPEISRISLLFPCHVHWTMLKTALVIVVQLCGSAYPLRLDRQALWQIFEEFYLA